MKYIFQMNREELIIARTETVAEIAEQSKKPMHVQAQFGNALESRLYCIDIEILHKENLQKRIFSLQ